MRTVWHRPGLDTRGGGLPRVFWRNKRGKKKHDGEDGGEGPVEMEEKDEASH